MKTTKLIALVLGGLMALSAATFTGCSKSDTEKAQDQPKDAGQKTGDALKDAAGKTKDALKDAAEKTLKRAQEEHPSRPEPFKALAEIYLTQRHWTDAAIVLSRLIEAQPENAEALIDFAALKIRMGAYQEALAPLERALTLQPDNFYARLNHGIACLQLTNLDAARHDYELLERRAPKPLYAIHYGLGEIAYQKKQKETALEHYEKYLELAPRGTAEMRAIEARVKGLKSGAS